jgi:zinc protease
MRNRCFILLLMLCASAAAPAGPRIASWQTATGAKVLFVRASEIPMADVRVVFDAGSARDGVQWGLAGLTNAMLAEGANGLSGHTISERFDDVGARYGSGALRDMAWVSLRGITEAASLEVALTTLAQVLQSPDFPVSALERERKRMITGLKQREQDPGAKAEDAFYFNLYKDHPYGSPPQGNESTLLALKREDVLRFYRRFYSAPNAIVAIVGDLGRDRAAAIAEQLASKLPPGTKPPPLPPAPALNQTLEVKVPFESTQTHVWVGAPGMARVDPDTFPLYVGNHTLGGGGFVSRLYKTIRERRGLSYSVYSYFIPMRVTGPFIAALQTSNAQAGKALHLLVDTVQDYIETGPSAAELDASKKNIRGGFPLRIDSNSEIVEYLVIIGFYDLPLDYLETYVDRVKAVSLSEIRDAYQRRLHPANLVKIIVGPERAETASALPAAPPPPRRHLHGGGTP